MTQTNRELRDSIVETLKSFRKSAPDAYMESVTTANLEANLATHALLEKMLEQLNDIEDRLIELEVYLPNDA